MQENEKKETITLAGLKELIDSMKDEEFVIEIPIGGVEHA